MSPVIPFIDPRVKRMGISDVRSFNLDKMREFAKSDGLIVFHQSDKELAVMVPFDLYQEMAAAIRGYNDLVRESQR